MKMFFYCLKIYIFDTSIGGDDFKKLPFYSKKVFSFFQKLKLLEDKTVFGYADMVSEPLIITRVQRKKNKPETKDFLLKFILAPILVMVVGGLILNRLI